MRFDKTPLPGAFVIEPEPIADERGFFARSWCAEEFAARGLDSRLAQCNISYNAKRGTLRGLHCQAEPGAEAKLVRCTQGAVFDVIVDLRPGSPTYLEWFGVDLTGRNRRMLFAPEGFAHGFQTLADDSEVFYQMSRPYAAELARGIRYDDPVLAIAWPIPNPILSPHDRALPRIGQAGAHGAAACW